MSQSTDRGQNITNQIGPKQEWHNIIGTLPYHGSYAVILKIRGFENVVLDEADDAEHGIQKIIEYLKKYRKKDFIVLHDAEGDSGHYEKYRRIKLIKVVRKNDSTEYEQYYYEVRPKQKVEVYTAVLLDMHSPKLPRILQYKNVW